MATRADLEQDLAEAESELSTLKSKLKKAVKEAAEWKTRAQAAEHVLALAQEERAVEQDFIVQQQSHIQMQFEIIEGLSERTYIDSY
jgi:3-methyladenine DNA glycosylase/8-oxoguanine DNA glycosylase